MQISVFVKGLLWRYLNNFVTPKMEELSSLSENKSFSLHFLTHSIHQTSIGLQSTVLTLHVGHYTLERTIKISFRAHYTNRTIWKLDDSAWGNEIHRSVHCHL